MSFVKDTLSIGVPGTEGDPFQSFFPGGEDDPFFGGAAAAASGEAAQLQAQAAREALEAERLGREQAQTFFEPFAGAAERGVEASGFLADPEAQFEFLQSNPLFQSALQNANKRTGRQAAASKRLSFGDTLQQLSNNVLLSASPLIDRQRQDVTNLLNLGTGIAESQANISIGEAANVGNLLTDIGAVQAGGQIGAANALSQGGSNLLGTGLSIASLFSDERLKEDIKKVGEINGHNIYTWTWNKIAGDKLNLFGESIGVLAQEVLKLKPEAVILDGDFYKVNYGAI